MAKNITQIQIGQDGPVHNLGAEGIKLSSLENEIRKLKYKQSVQNLRLDQLESYVLPLTVQEGNSPKVMLPAFTIQEVQNEEIISESGISAYGGWQDGVDANSYFSAEEEEIQDVPILQYFSAEEGE